MAISVVVHPQLMLQLSEQFTRRPFLNPAQPYAIGVILGLVSGPRIEVCSAIEVGIRQDPLRLATQDYRVLLRQHQQIYRDEQPVGWYACQELDTEYIDKFHTLFGALDHIGPFLRGEFVEREQPLRLFLQCGEGWTVIEYSYESEPAERIALMQLQSEGNAESQVAFTADAYRSLDSDLEIIEKWLRDVANGVIKFDPVLVRKCAEVAQWWDHKAEVNERRIIDQENLGMLIGRLTERVVGFKGSMNEIR
jgi:hypothetical protein